MDTIKLLLVEDDPSLRYIVQSGLEDIIEGYEVLAAANGEEGLAMWRASSRCHSFGYRNAHHGWL